jgi:GxxExxY protein
MEMKELERDPLTRAVIGAAIEVHRELGIGLLESAYEECLAYELNDRGILVRRQVLMPLKYKKHRVDRAYKMDLVVNDVLIIEIKALDKLQDVHEAQLLTYLRFSGLKKGLLLNFHVPMLKLGIRRYVM